MVITFSFISLVEIINLFLNDSKTYSGREDIFNFNFFNLQYVLIIPSTVSRQCKGKSMPSFWICFPLTFENCSKRFIEGVQRKRNIGTGSSLINSKATFSSFLVKLLFFFGRSFAFSLYFVLNIINYYIFINFLILLDILTIVVGFGLSILSKIDSSKIDSSILKSE